VVEPQSSQSERDLTSRDAIGDVPLTSMDTLRKARWYVEAWTDEYQSDEGRALLARIDAILGAQ
jgi:hypothetical protein